MNKFSISEEVAGAETIGISGHIRPDGDCVGSCMGLYLYLKKNMPQTKVMLYLEKPSDIFDCISGIDEIITLPGEYESSETAARWQTSGQPAQGNIPVHDVFFALDCACDRLGAAEELFLHAKKKINIDHHISNANGCGDVNYVEPQASSTAELIYELLEHDRLDIEIAKALYIGIIHDCGVFQYSNTSPRTLRIAAALVEYGFNFSKLIDETFYEKTYVQNQIMGRALLESILFMDGKCIASCVDRRMMEFYGVGPKDLDGIVNQLRIIKGVECAIFMYETALQEYKVSLRANHDLDVSRVAVYFGGGGHVKAAGCTMRGNFYDVVNNLSEQIALQLRR